MNLYLEIYTEAMYGESSREMHQCDHPVPANDINIKLDIMHLLLIFYFEIKVNIIYQRHTSLSLVTFCGDAPV